jgi:zinc/manganese transport system substrate-binding protein
MKAALPLRGKKIAAYHTIWIYFKSLYGLEIIGYVEPKPGIPPSPKHIEELVQEMRNSEVKVLLAANYFDENKVRTICDKVGAEPVIVPMFVNGAPGTENVYKLIDVWIRKLNEAFAKMVK